MSKAKRTRSKRANVTVSKTDYLPNILKKLDDLSAIEVIIGAQGDAETAMIAAIHEFGSLKAGIPARSFIGIGRKKAQAAVSKLARSGVTNIILKSESAKGLLNSIGQIAESKMLVNFDKLRTPPLSPVYARRKGSTKILVQEQQLRDSIAFTIVPRRKR
jgi:phage gpG-like protein